MKKVLLPIAILLIGFGLAAAIIATGPQLEHQAPPPTSPLVRTWQAEPATVQLTSITHGTVLPRSQTDLVPEVAGRVVRLSEAMVTGGFFAAGSVLFELDPLDYEVALEQATAAAASAQSELANARRAHTRQLDLARKQSTSESLRDEALNRLRFAEAGLREANARVSRARRDLSRTRITAPYDGRVRTESVDVGQFVNRGQTVAKIYATDYAEVRLPVHDDELAFLRLPLNAQASGQQPAAANQPEVILRARFAGQEHTWEGRVVRTEGELDPQTRMINMVAQVEEPYQAQGDRPPLAVGLFVEAEILGKIANRVYTLPRSAIQANDQVYVIDEANRIEFRNVDILRTVGEQVYVTSGIERGETICLSTINNAIEGMAVRPFTEQDNNAAEAISSNERTPSGGPSGGIEAPKVSS